MIGIKTWAGAIRFEFGAVIYWLCNLGFPVVSTLCSRCYGPLPRAPIRAETLIPLLLGVLGVDGFKLGLFLGLALSCSELPCSK